METTILNKVSIKRDEIVKISEKITKVVLDFEKEIIQNIIEQFKLNSGLSHRDLTEEEIEMFTEDAKRTIKYSKVIYPNQKHYLLTNGKDGDYEYHYQLKLLEDKGIRVKMKNKTVFNESSTCYLIEKSEFDKPSYVFYHECNYFDTDEINELILVILK
jgi:archaellin